MRRFFPLLIILVALVVVLFPLTHSGFFVSDDGDWMIIRLSAFYQSLREGQFPVRFVGRLNNSYGYPVSNFLYPGYLYIGSLFHAMGLPFIVAIKVILAGSITGAAFFIYAWLRKYFSPFASSMGTISFVTLPYIGFDLYTRGSVGELLAFFAMAMCLYSIAWVKRPLFALSVLFLIVSHNSLALIFSVFLLTHLVHARKLKIFLVPSVIGLCMASFFWLPAIIERPLTLFDSVTIADSASYFLSIKTLYLVGSAFLVCGLSCLRWARSRRTIFFLWWAAVGIFLACPMSEIFWNASLVNLLFQFPFRFLSILAICIPFILAAIFEYCPKKHRALIISLFVVVWISDAWRTLSWFHSTKTLEESYLTNEATTTVHDEYLPKWVRLREPERAQERIVFYEGSGTIMPKVYTGHAFAVTVDATEDSVLQINTIYYPGWGVAVDSRGVEIDYDNPSGLMRVPITKGAHTVEVAFRETLSRLLIDFISLISAIWFVLFSLKKRT